ncbi:hypothetical protein BC828DRAFT_96565 [Blastocladiella britannica]|nr:hypothetical protein BC828DRAFT_96565 [Blastocladiella britannica]
MNTLLSESLLLTHCFSNAAIVRRKDLTPKARTAEWPLTSTDLDKLDAMFEHPVTAREQGIVLGNTPYRVLRADQHSIYGKLDEDTQALMRQQEELAKSQEQQQYSGDASILAESAGGGTAATTTTGAATATAPAGATDPAPAAASTTGGRSTQQQNHTNLRPVSSATASTSPGTPGTPFPGTPDDGSRPDRDKAVVQVVRPPASTMGGGKYDGILICCTGMFYLIGIYDRHPGMAVEAMERLADWFRSKRR